MKKSYDTIIIVLIIGVILAGCSSKEKHNDNMNLDSASIAENGLENQEKPQGVEIISDKEKFTKVVENQEFNKNTDMNTACIPYCNITEVADGINLTLGNKYIFNLSRESDISLLLCDKPECSHQEEGCSANMEINGAYPSGMQCYNNKLYFVEVGGTDLSLYKSELDGTNREKVITLGSIDTQLENTGNSIRWVIHRGYIYYTYQMSSGMTEDTFYLNGSNCLYRQSLDNDKEKKLIMPLIPESNSGFMVLKAYGSYLYFVILRADCDAGKVYRYNTESDKVEELTDLGDSVTDILIHDNEIFYKTYSDDFKIVYKYNLESGMSEPFVECEDAEGYELFGDEKYIYVSCHDNSYEYPISSKAKVYTWEGEFQGEIRWSLVIFEETESGNKVNAIYIAGMDDERIYYTQNIQETEDAITNQIVFMNKSDIGKDNVPMHVAGGYVQEVNSVKFFK